QDRGVPCVQPSECGVRPRALGWQHAAAAAVRPADQLHPELDTAARGRPCYAWKRQAAILRGRGQAAGYHGAQRRQGVVRGSAVARAALGLLDAIPPPLATAVGISIPAHVAVYGLTPVLSLHVVALGGSATQVGVLFSVFALVAVVLRPL